ncbi:scaffolding protein [Arthrobacter phage DrManhattan]|uniref:Scaffolding protein n=1 Tax=Arthrobacter phage DrManhattan TaxID=2419955 RepID=A0A3G2KFG3_9CAUD|nr:head scaffolding protein [Arthrobacter phage DrManhattan]AYN57726.1 scaffolding protein [Arthrobacter phage DrManhattan]
MADTENQNTAQTDAEKAPWGDDFDAERAWKLVQNLRAERDGLKTERDSLKGERDALVTERDGLKTELQTKTEELEKTSKETARELALQKVLRKHPELEDFADLLTGDTEEELTSKAERLASLGKPKEPADNGAPADEQKPADAPEIPGKPTPSLTPGHGGEENAPFDPVAIAKAARRN